MADAPRLSSPLREEHKMVKVDVKMLKTTKGADDGINVKPYFKDMTYCVGPSLAKAFLQDMRVAEGVNEPTEDGKEVEEKKDKVINWLEVDLKKDKHITRDKLVAVCDDLKINPRDDANKPEILELIQAKVREDGDDGEKKSLLDKAKDFVSGDKKDDEG